MIKSDSKSMNFGAVVLVSAHQENTMVTEMVFRVPQKQFVLSLDSRKWSGQSISIQYVQESNAIYLK